MALAPLQLCRSKPKPSIFFTSNPRHPSSSPSRTNRSMRITMSTATSKNYWTSMNDEIKGHLLGAIRVRDPVVVFEPMNRLAFAGPKSMAPALCVAACELVGGHRAQALPAASAVQVMHAAVHIHDNLPFMSHPSPINLGFGPNIQMLTGDGLLSFAYELLARCKDTDNLGEKHSSRVIQAVVEMARTMGSQGMVDGRFREVECGQLDNIGETCEEGWLRYAYEKRDGGLHACAAACGAILGGGSEHEIEKLRKYGLYVGTIHGILNGIERHNEGLIEMLQNLREMALKELEDFNATKIEAISALIHVCNT